MEEIKKFHDSFSGNVRILLAYIKENKIKGNKAAICSCIITNLIKFRFPQYDWVAFSPYAKLSINLGEENHFTIMAEELPLFTEVALAFDYGMLSAEFELTHA